MIEIVHDEKCAWVAYPKWLSCDCVRLKLQHLESENAALRKAVEAASSLLSEDAMREAGSCFVALQIFDDAVERLDGEAE